MTQMELIDVVEPFGRRRPGALLSKEITNIVGRTNMSIEMKTATAYVLELFCNYYTEQISADELLIYILMNGTNFSPIIYHMIKQHYNQS